MNDAQTFYTDCSYCDIGKMDCIPWVRGPICGDCRRDRVSSGVMKTKNGPDPVVYGANPFPLSADELRSVGRMLDRNNSEASKRIVKKILKFLTGNDRDNQRDQHKPAPEKQNPSGE